METTHGKIRRRLGQIPTGHRSKRTIKYAHRFDCFDLGHVGSLCDRLTLTRSLLGPPRRAIATCEGGLHCLLY